MCNKDPFISLLYLKRPQPCTEKEVSTIKTTLTLASAAAMWAISAAVLCVIFTCPSDDDKPQDIPSAHSSSQEFNESSNRDQLFFIVSEHN